MTRQFSRLPAASAAGYLLGTIPSADLATRLANTDVSDLRSAGSGNPGAINAADVLGVRWGLAVLAADMSKGAIAGGLGRGIAGPAGACAAATTSIAGHIVPIWKQGRGGKGVATSAGACLIVFPAFFPIDAVVAFLGATRLRDAEHATRLSCAAWVVASLLWWRRHLPNAWGPPAGPSTMAFALFGSAMILTKFRLSRKPIK